MERFLQFPVPSRASAREWNMLQERMVHNSLCNHSMWRAIRDPVEVGAERAVRGRRELGHRRDAVGKNG